MAKYKFGDVVKEVKNNVNREDNPYEFYVAGDHMDSEDIVIRRKGRFATDDVGPAFTRIFNSGQILYGSRRTYLKKVAVADFEGICANTTFVLETRDNNVLLQELLPYIMLTDAFTTWSVSHSKGSTNPYVLFSDLADYEFELPPIEEQRVLVRKLVAAQKLKESYRTLLMCTDELVKSQFIEMFDFKDLQLTAPSDDFEKYCKDTTSKAQKIPASDYLDKGKYAIFDQAQDNVIAGFSNNSEGVCNNYPVVLFGDHSRVIKYINQPYYIGADGVKIISVIKDEIIPEFLYYDLLYHTIPNTGYNRHFKYIKMLKLTVPSIERQNEFLAIAHQADKSKSVNYPS